VRWWMDGSIVCSIQQWILYPIQSLSDMHVCLAYNVLIEKDTVTATTADQHRCQLPCRRCRQRD
jgi:hypothetical protein